MSQIIMNALQITGGNDIIWGLNKHINPRQDSKFSPNLWKYLTYSNKHNTNVFQDPKDGYFYIGLREPNGIWGGSKLMRVFCVGNGAETFSYPTDLTKSWNDVTEKFWAEYLKVGKAIYDSPFWKTIH